MLTEQEKKRLAELTAAKKKAKLNDADFAEFKALMKKQSNKSKERGGSKDPKCDPGNDFSWWSKLPDLLRDSATFKSNYIAGKVIDPTRIPYVVPGVLEIQLVSCYNPSAKATDPVNVWARNNYLKMFQKYRPASGYSASDQGIAVLAGLEVVKLIATYERIYGVINRYSVKNVNMPLVEAEALGLSATQVNYLQSHLSDFRYDLNFLIRKAQRICIPKDIALIEDAISLLGYEYIDHGNPRGQIIIFNLSNYGVYSDIAMSTGGEIEFYDSLITDLFDFNADNMCKALVSTLNALLGSDSIQRIYADLVVWFGEEAMLQFLPLPEDYMVLPVESKSILHKMHNLECAPAPLTSDGTPASFWLTSWAITGMSTADTNHVLNGDYHVYQYNDNIVTVGACKDTNVGTPVSKAFDGTPGSVLEGTDDIYGLGDAHLVDGYEVDINPEFMVEGSLLKYTAEPVASTDHLSAVITSCVNWLVKSMDLHIANGSPYSVSNWTTVSFRSSIVAGELALIDWAPLSYYITFTGMSTIINRIYGDLDVIVPVSAGDLSRIQRTCFMSGLSTDLSIKA